MKSINKNKKVYNNKIWVKICGITNFEDGFNSIIAGADALGFILSTNSLRRISLEKAQEIIAKIKSEVDLRKNVSFVAVLVNEDYDTVKNIIDKNIFHILQLSGDESLSFIQKIKSYNKNIKLIKTLRIDREKPSIKKINSYIFKQLQSENIKKDKILQVIDFFLLDSLDKEKYGGTGIPLNWSEIKKVEAILGVPVILAGGLNPNNVKLAINLVKPFGVDCSSGVEVYPGKKDIKKLTDFINNILALQNIGD